MKKVMVGIIGCGTIANSAHIPAYLKNEDVEIKYFCDIIPERAKAASSALRISSSFSWQFYLFLQAAVSLRDFFIFFALGFFSCFSVDSP